MPAPRGNAVRRAEALPHLGSERRTPSHPDGRRAGVDGAVAGLHLHAVSVLDMQIFNPEMEEERRTHFDFMSDADLVAMNPKDLTAGLLDRAERLDKGVRGGARAARNISEDRLMKLSLRFIFGIAWLQNC
jgi:hypothetical protein